MGDSDKKVVRFEVYCKKCEYWKNGKEIPYCDDCLQVSITEPIEEPASETTVEAASDPMLHHDSSFMSNYIRVGLDMDELMALGILFKNKKVRVNIEITELD